MNIYISLNILINNKYFNFLKYFISILNKDLLFFI
jgi:hypothetical protein